MSKHSSFIAYEAPGNNNSGVKANVVLREFTMKFTFMPTWIQRALPSHLDAELFASSCAGLVTLMACDVKRLMQAPSVGTQSRRVPALTCHSHHLTVVQNHEVGRMTL
ncbi:hypothetical protein TNCV_3659861 [Trichonephila clavipes]|nr:hypothetical protein TNCV_3659861 [Trichonephila clavipes]